MFIADIHNWNLNETEVKELSPSINQQSSNGDGGFIPFGVAMMIQGAAKCFFAFIGFDIIACVGKYKLLFCFNLHFEL